jgi:hypothetical protein
MGRGGGVRASRGWGGGARASRGRGGGVRTRAGRGARRALAAGLLALVLGGCTPAGPAGSGHGGRGPTYAALGRRALLTLEREYYDGAGRWHMCVPVRCYTTNMDWGADSLTYTLYLHWLLTGDRRVAPIMNALTATAPGSHAGGWSDVPMWDSIAAAREYQVTGNAAALRTAVHAFRYVADTGRKLFARGACPIVFYQQPGGGYNKLKTLETGSNYIKAALLLYQITRSPRYLAEAEAQYQAVRTEFLSRGVPLYTVYVFDSGHSCFQLPARYFGSVNGNMIWAGYYLAKATGRAVYRAEAVATARAVADHLCDATGVYADLQAENDIAEPLIEAMYDLAAYGHQAFARRWLLTAASASASDVTAGGSYGRFFDGPPPRGTVTAWQANGGLALAVVAAALDPGGRPADPRFWVGAPFVADDLVLGRQPVHVTFTGRAVAIIGTIGAVCCEPGHARVFIDGRPTFDQTGIWQNKSSGGVPLANSVLFAWRWPVPGRHTIEISPGYPNGKEGGSFFHMTGYYVVR